MGDALYVTGTLLQLIAFGYGCRPTTLGLALAAYGVGLYFTARSW